MDDTNNYPGGLQQFLYQLGSHLNKFPTANYIKNEYVKNALFASFKNYQFVINTSDHPPAHFHVSENNHQIAKYSLLTGEPIESSNPRLDKVVRKWLGEDGRLEKGKILWEKFHGAIT